VYELQPSHIVNDESLPTTTVLDLQFFIIYFRYFNAF
jgi:hypothetical protein